jgi:N-formylglutamate amidohydrolase
MAQDLWQTEVGEAPLVACAVHDGRAVRPEVGELLRLTDAERRYEEDPFTGRWTSVAPTRVVASRSRFEVDLNRPRELAVYLGPENAWGLEVWKSRPSQALIDRSLADYDGFYAHWQRLLEGLLARHPRVVVFDLHSYNHRRQGPDGPAADPEQNPEINVGTRTMDRPHWARVVDRAMAELRQADYLDRHLDVRENVKFFGGHLATWTHQHFPRSVCVLAIEVKKTFMDEWSGALDERRFQALARALESAAAGVLAELEYWDRASNDASID